MKLPDTDKIRSEKILSLPGFIQAYNENLPADFQQATPALLREFKKTHPTIFKDSTWSLDQHRKKVMDWLTSLSAKKTEF